MEFENRNTNSKRVEKKQLKRFFPGKQYLQLFFIFAKKRQGIVGCDCQHLLLHGGHDQLSSLPAANSHVSPPLPSFLAQHGDGKSHPGVLHRTAQRQRDHTVFPRQRRGLRHDIRLVQRPIARPSREHNGVRLHRVWEEPGDAQRGVVLRGHRGGVPPPPRREEAPAGADSPVRAVARVGTELLPRRQDGAGGPERGGRHTAEPAAERVPRRFQLQVYVSGG